MSDNYNSKIRKQLLDQGYRPLPNLDKRCMLRGWQNPYGKLLRKEGTDTWPDRFPDWRATGVQAVDGLAPVDFDSNDEQMAKDWLAELKAIAPEVYAQAPMRFGGGTHKRMLFARTDAAGDQVKRPIRSRKWRRPGEEDEHHQLEIFLSEAGSDKCSRQVGCYGPHSAGRDYRFDPETPALHEVPLIELPRLTYEQACALVDAFDTLASHAGWEVLSTNQTAGDAAIVFDIDEHTVFDMADGSQVNYANLCEMWAPGLDLRCTSSFHGDVGENASKCRVGAIDMLGGVIGVWDNEEYAWHAPAPYDEAKLAEGLKAAAEAAGIEIPFSEPNWVDRYKNGDPKATMLNVKIAIAHNGWVCSYDVFHDKLWLGRGETAPILTGPAPPFIGEVDDARMLLLRDWMIDAYGRDFTGQHVRDAVTALCRRNTFDPVVDMLEDAQASWDGTPRLDRVAADYFMCDDTELNRAFVRKTLIGAVARARQPGIKFDTILVMESPEGFNKSSAWAVLAGEGNFSDTRIIGHADREVVEQLAGVWIHENADLAGMKKAEVETVKAYASRQVDSARMAYGHFVTKRPRRSIDVGTTNSETYLQSQTGNRRFWPMRVNSTIDLAKLRRDRLQIWGEAAHAHAGGEGVVLDEHLWAAAGAEQEARRLPNLWEAILANMAVMPPESPLGHGDFPTNIVLTCVADEVRVHTKTILTKVLEIAPGHMNRGHAITLAETMKVLGWTKRDSLRIEGVVATGYSRKIKGN